MAQTFGGVAPCRFDLHVVGLLTESGTTRTWRARTRDGRPVALVVLRPEVSPEDRQRFARTAREVAAKGDVLPHVLRVHQVAASLDAIVTDLWTDGTARDLCALHWPVERRLGHGRKVVEALAALHALGQVHGALTMDSVLLDDELEPVLGELGTVSRREPFAAPEVCHGGEPTPRSDVYSAGRMLQALLEKEASPRLADVLSRCLSPLPHLRFASASELASALDLALESAHPPSGLRAARAVSPVILPVAREAPPPRPPAVGATRAVAFTVCAMATVTTTIATVLDEHGVGVPGAALLLVALVAGAVGITRPVAGAQPAWRSPRGAGRTLR